MKPRPTLSATGSWLGSSLAPGLGSAAGATSAGRRATPTRPAGWSEADARSRRAPGVASSEHDDEHGEAEHDDDELATIDDTGFLRLG